MKSKIDERALGELITESQDLQVDAMRDARTLRPLIAEAHRETAAVTTDPAVITRHNDDRRRILRNGGMGIGALAGRGLLGTAFGSAILGIVAQPVSAQEDVAVQIFQTASSLENLAVATYGAALTLPFFGDNGVVKTFAETTMKQHGEHAAAFKAQTKDLGGRAQEATNPKYTPVVEAAKPMLTDYSKVVALAATLEEVAQDTYLADLSLLTDGDQRQLIASVLAVETQHLATLRAVGALLDAGAADLIAIPTNLAKLPAAAGSVAFPKAFEEPDMASPPEEGAL